tara:strand:- start:4854 stop:5258 length:405 start_codon:yes stop_codon:yes gene_type:complete
MLHKIVTALMIWGLILQPLVAAVPGPMLADSSSTVVVVDSDNTMAAHHAMSDDNASTPPCHEMVDEVPESMDCANCDDGCASGACASSCSLSAPAILGQTLTRLAGQSPVRAIATSDALVQGLLTRIFHPPKHA